MSNVTEASTNSPVDDATKRLNKLQVNRIKKAEEEDQWISGEELYTEGSSDEDEKGKGTRRPRKEHKGARPKTHRVRPASHDRRAADDKPTAPAVQHPADSDCEEPIDISWKPKRGSIKLPNLVKELETISSKKEPIAE